MICPNCNGSRWLIQPLVLDDGRSGIVNLPCPVCRGTGNVSDAPEPGTWPAVSETLDPPKRPGG